MYDCEFRITKLSKSKGFWTLFTSLFLCVLVISLDLIVGVAISILLFILYLSFISKYYQSIVFDFEKLIVKNFFSKIVLSQELILNAAISEKRMYPFLQDKTRGSVFYNDEFYVFICNNRTDNVLVINYSGQYYIFSVVQQSKFVTHFFTIFWS